jgi:hypothetical protein
LLTEGPKSPDRTELTEDAQELGNAKISGLGAAYVEGVCEVGNTGRPRQKYVF